MSQKTVELKRRSCTQRELADTLGISQVTVHRALSDHPSVKPAVRQRVLETADRLGYRRNEMARSMVTGRSHVLGYINCNPSAEVQSRIMVGAQEEADRHDFLMKLLHVPMTPDESHVRAAVTRCVEHRIAGVMASLPPDMLPALQREAARYELPVALLDDIEPHGWGVRVSTDDESGIRQAVEHLEQLGHRHIALISGPQHSTLANIRAQSFRATMQRSGLPLNDESVVFSEWVHLALNTAAARKVLSATPCPTAVVCGSDYIAMIVLRVAYEAGWRVPRDLSVVGFSNLSFAGVSYPALTSVSQPFEELGRVAVRRLLAGLDAEASLDAATEDAATEDAATELVPTQLVVRESTAAPREHNKREGGRDN